MTDQLSSNIDDLAELAARQTGDAESALMFAQAALALAQTRHLVAETQKQFG